MYLQQVASKIGKRVKYIKPKKECAFIHIAEVFVTNINLHNLQMDVEEYRSILTAL